MKNASEDLTGAGKRPLRIVAFLREHHADLLDDLKRQLQGLSGRRELSRDPLPAVLETLTRLSNEASGGDPRRLRRYLEIAAVTSELVLLRRVIQGHLVSRMSDLELRELVLLDRSIDEAMIDSCVAHAEELRNEKTRLSALLDSLPAAMLVAEAPSGALIYRNRRVSQALGQPYDPLKNLSEYPRYGWFRSDGAPMEPGQWPLARALQRGETVDREEAQIERGDGTRGTYLLSSSPICDAEGHILSAVMTITDISRQKRAEAEAQERAEFEKQLVGIVSHDLRNPIAAISMGGWLLSRSALDEHQRKTVARIISAAERAQRMVRDLLDFTRVKLGGGIDLALGRVNVEEVLLEALAEVRLSHPDREISFASSGDCVGQFDADRLAQIITNLLSNALQYGPPGVPVRVETEGTAHRVTVSVWNGGFPIPPERVARLFEPLNRGAEDSAERSIGLGLFIVKKLVNAHGGTVEASSGAKVGTTFRVRLPKRPQERKAD